VERLDPRGRSNGFGLMRLLLAVLVIVSHAFPLGGFGVDPTGWWTHAQVNLGFLALLGFFTLSAGPFTEARASGRGLRIGTQLYPVRGSTVSTRVMNWANSFMKLRRNSSVVSSLTSPSSLIKPGVNWM
jgi:hypothetical protein